MNISSRCEYGFRAVLELASHDPTHEPLTGETIAERRRIPHKFLVHILLQLKRAGIVRSVRGAKGGYLLVRSPEDISLLHIIEAIDGPILGSLPVRSSESADLTTAWRTVRNDISEILSRVSIRDIMDGGPQQPMYYI